MEHADGLPRPDGGLLIADAGGTSTKWSFGAERWRTTGVNPSTAEGLPCDTPEGIRPGAIVFYGAGCLPHTLGRMEAWLRGRYPSARTVTVLTDLVGACRALLGRRAGVAAILGTGSASCLWDGAGVVRQTPSLGYLLGDEGSGAHLGRTLLSDALKGVLPPATCRRFLADTGLDTAGAIAMAYRSAAPARELARLAPWLAGNRGLEGVTPLIEGCMEAFVRRNLLPYGKDAFSAVGSVANAFRPELEQAAARCGMRLERVVAEPLELLAAYHSHGA